MFVSVDGKARKVLEIFAGGTDGKAKRVTELFGSVNGTARLLFSIAPPATNAFDRFTWADIKQLANEGKLLEHFNLYDRVTVQLKTPLENELSLYLDGFSKTIKVQQKQTEMVFQIVELTETKMRLMSPRVSVLGSKDFDIPTSYHEYMDSRYKSYASDFEYKRNSARSYCSEAWGLTATYDALKAIQGVLPDDLLSVVSVSSKKPLIYWEKNTITGSIERKYDDDLRVRQLSSNVFRKGTKTGEDGVIYPVIYESYFPTTISDYLYHIKLPEEYDTYEVRKALVKRHFDGFKLQDHQLSGETFSQSYSDAPEMSCAYTRGLTTNAEWSAFTDGKAGTLRNVLPKDMPVGMEVVFPEVIIEADA